MQRPTTFTPDRIATGLSLGETNTIFSFTNEMMSAKFLEMGCCPSSSIRLVRKGIRGMTYYFMINGYAFAMRKEEAAQIILVR